MYNVIKRFAFLISTIGVLSTQAQDALDAYLKEGLSSNRVLQQKDVSLEQSKIALKMAKSFYLPSLELGGSYTLADGGRTIDLPLGDLLNPAYSTLNQLTASDQFPLFENQQEQFFPNNFYDARFRVSYAVLNTDRRYGSQIREQQVQISELELEVYRADLKRDIKQAYYNYAITEAAVNIFEETLELVERNLRNTQSLLDNGKGLPAYVLRAESDVEDIKSKIIDAQAKRKNAGYYLNFLVNRDLLVPIEYEQPDLNEAAIPAAQGPFDMSLRPEIAQLTSAQNIADLQVKQSKAYLVPSLNAFLDLGAQDFDFEFDDQSRYYLFGLELNVPIFSGNRNNLSIRDRELNTEILRLQKENVEQQLSLAASMAQNNIESSISALVNARKKRAAARSYFSLLETGFQEGANAYIEYLDARNQLTQAELDLAITYFKLLTNQAILERELTTTSNTL
ncbi:MAG: TolC family protein [Bacteroidota bacterium]